MQNSAHFGKNGVSYLVRERKIFCCFFASNSVRIYWKKGKFSAHCRRKTEKNTNVFDNLISMSIWETMMTIFSKTCLLTIQNLFRKVETQTTGTIFHNDLLDIALLNLWCCYYVP